MTECIRDGIIDTLKILPYLLITFIVIEFIEHKFTKKNKKILSENKKYGPIIGGILGALPQCGFSTMAANLFSAKIITMGTLIAIFLSTSDEMLPVMISEKTNITTLIKIIIFKIIIGIIIGYIIDLIYKKHSNESNSNNSIKEICDHDHCSCNKNGIIFSSIKHTIKIGVFILIANVLINIIILKIGENSFTNILSNNNIFTYFISSIIGLIPNCAGSVIITKLYLSNLISIGTLLAGLLTGSGIGILLLFKSNKNMKENIQILTLIYIIGVITGIVVDLII